MTKTGVKKAGAQAKAVQKILITQPRPESEKSPYFELARRYSVEMEFHPFIRLEGIPAREFRGNMLGIGSATAITTEKHFAIMGIAVDYFVSNLLEGCNQQGVMQYFFLYGNRSGNNLFYFVHFISLSIS